MPFVNRFFLNDNGAITYTGNTLGLSRSNTVAVPGTVDSIGAFVTTDTTMTFGAYPAGTTSSFDLNSATAVLQIPAGSTVLYAELIWGGTYINNGVDNSAFINDDVQFTTPMATFSVSPDTDTAFQVLLSNSPPFPPAFAYVRSADVTSLVQAGGAGSYTTGSVVGTIVVPDPTSNHAGWTLAVVYHNASLPLRNLSIRVGADVIQSTSGPVTTVVNGFATPFAGALNGRALISAQEGDANKTGDQALFGPTLATLTTLSGPNNFVDNFFASQINQDDGTLDTSGTFGLRNQINGEPGTNIIGGRQGWDITNVDVSSTLLNAQTDAVFQLETNGDGYLVNSIGLQFDIATPILSIVKSTPTISAVVGDVVTYSVTIKNTGIVDATNAVFTDNIDPEATFVTGSVTVNGSPVMNVDPATGVPLGTVSPNQTIVVTFQYTVASLPNDGEITDQSFVAFDFVPTPGSPVISTFLPSNIINIPIFQPNVIVQKSGSPSPVLLGNVVTYVVNVMNAGDLPITAVLTDPLPLGSSLVANSVTVNGVSIIGVSPVVGIPLGTLSVGMSSVVTFQVHVDAVPPGGNLINQSTVDFTFTPPGHLPIQGSMLSNQVIIPVLNPIFMPIVNVVKSSNETEAIVGETITYRITVTNNSVLPIQNTLLTDSIGPGAAFVPGSVQINNIPDLNANPETGIVLGILDVGVSVIVTFQYTIVSLPTPPFIVNTANIAFNFQNSHFNQPSNPVTVEVLQPVITLLKRAGLDSVSVGQTLNYSVTVTNTGNIAANTTVRDPLNAYSSFVPGTVRIDGVLNFTDSPLTGIPIGSVLPGQSIVVSYDVLITAVPPTQFYLNQASATFTFQSPGGQIGNGNTVSNVVEVRNVSFHLVVVKSVSNSMALVGDRVTYAVSVSNTGNTSATDAVLVDLTSPGTQFVPGSATVNGAPVTGDVTQGLPLGTIAPGQSVFVTFQADIIFIPQPTGNIIDSALVSFTEAGVPSAAVSEPVTVNVTQPIVSAQKSAREPFVFVGDLVHYQTNVQNIGSFNALATWFDLLPEGSVFVANSLTLSGIPDPGVNMLTGALLGTIEANRNNMITFLLRVVSYPPTGVLFNQGRIVLDFVLPNGRPFQEFVETNPVTVPVLALPTLVKSAGVTEAQVGSSFYYTIIATNPNVTPIENVQLTDILPSGLSFIPNSVKINGATAAGFSPLTGIPLGTIPPKGTAEVRFQVNVDFEPEFQSTVNTAQITFQFVLPNGQRFPRTVISNPVIVAISEEEE
ncbi:DUF11 domain-containing protein [Cohnella herbarum]|uniref:DUF11 domain-containing protein n=1 Tax=Cohnella herbarum TaxID=2728023 RepID=A0A7Z2ZKB3_9BACL|nr:DUF11 domain-containing protein [Cohnella herbarum]QJD83016.1 DUF11 domain-containing protein [Cohnella herbarum]